MCCASLSEAVNPPRPNRRCINILPAGPGLDLAGITNPVGVSRPSRFLRRACPELKEIALERSPLLLSARFYASECLHNCGTERGRQDDLRAGISAELRGLQELRQRRPDCPGYGPVL